MTDGLGVLVADAVLDAVGELLSDSDGVGEFDRLRVGVADWLGDADSVAVELREGVSDGLGVGSTVLGGSTSATRTLKLSVLLFSLAKPNEKPLLR